MANENSGIYSFQDLTGPEWTARFEKEGVAYVKNTDEEYNYIEVTLDGLPRGDYAFLGMRYKSKIDRFVLETDAMNDRTRPDGTPVHTPEPENSRVIDEEALKTEGLILVVSPKKRPQDALNVFAMNRKTFRDRYEVSDPEKHLAKPIGMALVIDPKLPEVDADGNKIIGIEINAPWGGTQKGSRDCKILAVIDDPAHPENFSDTNRYLCDLNDFNYRPL